jgi:glutathione S-transferase
MVALHEKGLADKVEIVRTHADPMIPHEDLMNINPLSKIPTLERDDAPAIWDSRVICEWADRVGISGLRLFPEDLETRMIALRDEATGNGLMDVALPWLVEERLRPEALRSDEMIAVYRRKMYAVTDWLEAHIDEIAARPFDIGHLAIAVSLDYLDFRFSHEEWQKGRPRLATWHAEVMARPSFEATTFRDDPRPAG